MIIDVKGEVCPVPVIKAKKALKEMPFGTLEVLTDSDVAVKNLEKMARTENCLFSFKEEENIFHVFIEKEGKENAGQLKKEDEKSHEEHAVKGPKVVAIASDRMGSGDRKLGKILIKGFIFALTQMDELPASVLFYNSGAHLTVEGSSSIDDIKTLEAAGAEILTCGTCLDHYGIADKLEVGSVTNMYEIVDRMSKAQSIIRP